MELNGRRFKVSKVAVRAEWDVWRGCGIPGIGVHGSDVGGARE